jgi:hypothetical protein
MTRSRRRLIALSGFLVLQLSIGSFTTPVCAVPNSSTVVLERSRSRQIGWVGDAVSGAAAYIAGVASASAGIVTAAGAYLGRILFGCSHEHRVLPSTPTALD